MAQEEPKETGKINKEEVQRNILKAVYNAAAREQSVFGQFAQNEEQPQTELSEEELQQLMQMPLSEIELLPQEKKEIVWNALARHITEQQGIMAQMKTVAELGKKTAETFAEWGQRIRRLLEPTSAALQHFNEIMESIKRGVSNVLSEESVNTLQIWLTLAPYMQAELDAHPEDYKDNGDKTLEDLIAAAATRARADGKDIPFLKAEQREPEQLEFDLTTETDKETTRHKRIEETRKRHALAQAEGVLDTTSSNLATIAEKGLGFSYFTSEVIKGLPGGVEMKDLMLDAEGKINLYDLTQQGRELEEVDRIHTGFLMWLLGLAYHNSDLRETNSNNPVIPVYVPTVLKNMGIDPRPRQRLLNTETDKKELTRRQEGLDMADLRRDKLMEFLRPFFNMAAFFGEDLYQIVGFQNYIKSTETIYLAIPYLFRLVEYSKLHATRHGAIVNIFHADIMTENQTAVEVANRIAMGVLLRGLRPDTRTYKNTTTPQAKKTIQKTATDKDGNPVTVVIDTPPRVTTWAPKFSSLIKDCPQFARELEAIRIKVGAAEQEAIEAGRSADEIAKARKADHKTDPQRINAKLKDVFDAAIRIIMEKSDMPDYYAGFKIKTGRYDIYKPPTSSTLNDKLIITHKGKNPHYHE